MKQKHLLPFFHRSRKSTVNSMSFSKRKQKCCQYFSSTVKELTEYIVLYFTQVFKRVSCWKASLEGHCQVLQPLKKWWIHFVCTGWWVEEFFVWLFHYTPKLCCHNRFHLYLPIKKSFISLFLQNGTYLVSFPPRNLWDLGENRPSSFFPFEPINDKLALFLESNFCQTKNNNNKTFVRIKGMNMQTTQPPSS